MTSQSNDLRLNKKTPHMRKPSISPTPYVAPPPEPVLHGPLKRAAIAILKERRLPHNVEIRIDKALHRVGSKHRIVQAGDLRFKIRRQTSDASFVHNIVNKNDYNTTPEYEIRKTDTVIDVGGQIGTFALHAAKAASNGRVISFEPFPDSFALMETNIRLNRMQNIEAEQAAVTASPDPLKLYVTDFTGGNSMLPEYADDVEKFITVKSVTIPQIFDRYQIDRCNFLKIDCEGAEYDILYNLPQEYFDRIDRIVMEYHATSSEAKREESDGLVAHLEGAGFVIDEYLDFTDFNCGFVRARRP